MIGVKKESKEDRMKRLERESKYHDQGCCELDYARFIECAESVEGEAELRGICYSHAEHKNRVVAVFLRSKGREKLDESIKEMLLDVKETEKDRLDSLKQIDKDYGSRDDKWYDELDEKKTREFFKEWDNNPLVLSQRGRENLLFDKEQKKADDKLSERKERERTNRWHSIMQFKLVEELTGSEFASKFARGAQKEQAPTKKNASTRSA